MISMRLNRTRRPLHVRWPTPWLVDVFVLEMLCRRRGAPVFFLFFPKQTSIRECRLTDAR